MRHLWFSTFRYTVCVHNDYIRFIDAKSVGYRHLNFTFISFTSLDKRFFAFWPPSWIFVELDRKAVSLEMSLGLKLISMTCPSNVPILAILSKNALYFYQEAPLNKWSWYSISISDTDKIHRMIGASLCMAVFWLDTLKRLAAPAARDLVLYSAACDETWCVSSVAIPVKLLCVSVSDESIIKTVDSIRCRLINSNRK
jgi:hypothetical protein